MMERAKICGDASNKRSNLGSHAVRSFIADRRVRVGEGGVFPTRPQRLRRLCERQREHERACPISGEEEE